jgi:rare lipoprotein A
MPSRQTHVEAAVFVTGLVVLITLGGLFGSCVRPTYERSSGSISRTGRGSSGGERDVDAGVAPVSDASVRDGSVGASDGALAPDGGMVVLEVLEGSASYYSDRFEGHTTANGERYRASELTAASRDLPFGTIVRVVRIETGASVIVRINDRGPFGNRDRILDLSRAAAEALDMTRIGVVDIRAEILERGDGRRAR